MLAGLIGTPTSHSVVVVERGPVSFFADAVVDDNPVYKDPAAAKDEGFENIPVPPTYPFVMDHWGAFTEFQSGETFAGIGPALGALMSKGGLILHGEQEFTLPPTGGGGRRPGRQGLDRRRLPEGGQGPDNDVCGGGDQLDR